MTLYNISRQHKLTKEFMYLSQKKKRWLPGKSKRRFCVMTEAEAEAFTMERNSDPVYYYFRTHKVK